MTIKNCKIHGDTEHKMYSNGANRTKRARCVLCIRNNQNERRFNKKSQILSLMGNQCCICGYNKCIAALDFHHLDPKTKINNLGRMFISRNYDDCLNESQKCVVVCKNCHSEIENNHVETVNILNEILASK